MDDTPRPPQTAHPGEDLYGLSVAELEARIALYGTEITRLEAELVKKRAERDAADDIFKPRL